MTWAKQVLIAADQFVNTLLGGWADETLSARTYRMNWFTLEKIINFIMLDSSHCKNSYISEKIRAYSPPEVR
jgi:hypothetical protein